MAIEEFALDLNNPDEFQACHKSGTVYVRRPTHYGDDDWHEVYSVTDAETQFGDPIVDFRWVEINSAPGKEGHMYTQATEAYNAQGKDLWLMTSTDYGATWSRSLIINGIIRASGGIWAGRVTGDVMYASYNGHGLVSTCKIRYSTDEGDTWAEKAVFNASIWVTRVMIDPTDEGISYAGNGINGPNLRKALTTSGGYVTGRIGAGICIFYGYGGGWVSGDDGDYVRTIVNNTLHFTSDWTNWDENNVSDVGHGATFERAMWGHDSVPQWVGVASRTGISSPFVNYHLLKSTEDNGGTWYDKAGANASTATTGGGNSIPYNAGGVAENGLYLTIPGYVPSYVYTSVVAMGASPTGSLVYADGVQIGAIPDSSTVYAHGVEQENPRP